MKKIAILLGAWMVLGAGCTFRFDFMGRETLEEVTLVKSAAKEKILIVDVEGLISSLGEGSLTFP